MRHFQDLPIQRKLLLIILLTSVTALLLAAAAFAAYDLFAFKRTMVSNLNSTAQMIGFNSVSALVFDDVGSAEQTIKSLRAQAHIDGGCIYDKDGRIFSTYIRDAGSAGFPPLAAAVTERFSQNYLEMLLPIVFQDEVMGSVYLRSDLVELNNRWQKFTGIVGVVLLVAILIAWLIAARLQRIISDPVSQLAAIAGQVAEQKNYSVRAVKSGNDELGRLIDGFNDMLAQIQARDRELQAANDTLEQRVDQRTRDLQRENTERKTAESKLAHSLSVTNATLEAAVDGILVVDLKGKITTYNRTFMEMWRLPSEVLETGDDERALGMVIEQIKDTETFVQRVREVYGQREGNTFDVLEFKDGRTVERYTQPQRIGEEIVGRVMCFRDITERKRAEAVITYERDLLQTLMDSLPDHLYFKDLDSCFVRFSQSKLVDTLAFLSERHSGAEPLPMHMQNKEAFQSWFQGRTDFDLLGESAQPLFAEEQEIIRTGRPVAGKIESVVTASGDTLWFLVTKMPWRDAHGRIIGTYGISKNITDIKEAEAKLKAAHEQLMLASRKAGMAEVATGVLHNVGNVLNSVNVSATLVREKLLSSETTTLSRVAALLRSRSGDLDTFLTTDPKGRQVPGFVIQLADQLAAEHAMLLTEHEHLARNVEHIKDIVAMQQNYARVSGVLEQVRLPDLMGDALQMHTVGFARHGIEVVRDYTDGPPVIVDKHKVMQIFVNLIQNAKHALTDPLCAEGRITVKIARQGEDRIRVSVTDNGVGITTENLTRIFSHGFTTRRNGHGFGLHSGAIAARELGGSLHAASEGTGHGATFTLELPLNPPGRPQP